MDGGEHPRDAWARLVMGRWLLRWRIQTGCTQRRVAAIARIDQGFLSRVERGQRRIAGAPLARLILTLDWLSGGGLREGPYAGMHMPLPPLGSELPGRHPPVVVGTVLLDMERPDRPARDWEDVMEAMGRDAFNRRSAMQAPTVEEALSIRRRRQAAS